MKNRQTISDLLPEGVSEETLDKIVEAFNAEYQDQIDERIQDLTIKFTSLLRSKIDSLKEHALKELELENGEFRNAQLFDLVRSIMSVELSQKDSDYAVQSMSEEVNETSKQIDFLVEQNEQLNKEIRTLKTNNVALRTKSAKVIDENKQLVKEYNELLEEQSNQEPEPFHSSEKARVISRVDEGKTEQTKDDNPWITEEVVNLSRN